MTSVRTVVVTASVSMLYGHSESCWCYGVCALRLPHPACGQTRLSAGRCVSVAKSVAVPSVKDDVLLQSWVLFAT